MKHEPRSRKNTGGVEAALLSALRPDLDLKRAISGEVLALSSMFIALHPELLRLAMTLTDRQESDDAVHEAFAFLLQQVRTQNAIETQTNWRARLFWAVGTAARNQERWQRRTDERHTEWWHDASHHFGEWMDPTRRAEEGDIECTLQRAVERLSPRARHVYLLMQRFQLSYRDVAETLCLSESTIRGVFRRATDKLHAALVRAGYTDVAPVAFANLERH